MAALDKGGKGMKIGVPSEYVMDGMDSEVVALWEKGQACFAMPVPSLSRSRRILNTRFPPITSSRLQRRRRTSPAMTVSATASCRGGPLDDMWQTRAAGFGDEVQRRIMIGTYVLSAAITTPII